MKRSYFVILFCGVNIALVLLHIHKQSLSIEVSYSKQKNELERDALIKEKQELTNQLYSLHDRTQIKKFVQTHPKLQLKPVKIGQIKKMYDTSL